MKAPFPSFLLPLFLLITTAYTAPSEEEDKSKKIEAALEARSPVRESASPKDAV